MNCGYTFDEINEYADDEVSEEKADMVMEHLARCKVCRQYYDSIVLSEKYMKDSASLKCDVRMKVLESVDAQRYKKKRLVYRFSWLRSKTSLITKAVVAVACVFLAVLILRNEYAGGIISSGITKMLEQKQQNYTGYVDVNEDDASPVQKGDTLLYKDGSNYRMYRLIYPDGHESQIELPHAVYENQAFVSDDNSVIYYNTNFNEVTGRIIRYDIASGKGYDVLDELEIEIDGHISVISYENDRIIAIIGLFVENVDGYEIKIETNRLLEIDLEKKIHRFTHLPFTPWNATMIRGIDFIGDNYLISYMDSTVQEIKQRTVIVDTNGIVIREIPLGDPSYAVNMQVSPDNRMILYQLGQTPVDLYLYDIEKEKMIAVVDSIKKYNYEGIYSFCIFSAWSESPGTFYYRTMNHGEGEEEFEYRLDKYVIDEAAFDHVGLDNSKNNKDLQLLQMMFPKFEFEMKGDEIITYNNGIYLDYGMVSDNNDEVGQKSEIYTRYFIDRIKKGIFIEGMGKKSLLIVQRDGVAHADGFYHTYVAVFDESEMKLLTPVKHFFANEGSVSIFNGKDTSYVFFAGSTIYQGFSTFTGGLWKFEKEWIKVWPEDDETLWERRAVEANEDSITVLSRKMINKPIGGAMPHYIWDYSHKLMWNADKEMFERLEE